MPQLQHKRQHGHWKEKRQTRQSSSSLAGEVCTSARLSASMRIFISELLSREKKSIICLKRVKNNTSDSIILIIRVIHMIRRRNAIRSEVHLYRQQASLIFHSMLLPHGFCEAVQSVAIQVLCFFAPRRQTA